MFWITGLPASGKTTIATLLVSRLRGRHSHAVLLDGDVLREVFEHDLGYSLEDRRRCARRYARLGRMLAVQGVHVVTATISLFEDVRRWNRAHLHRYVEVYVRAPRLCGARAIGSRGRTPIPYDGPSSRNRPRRTWSSTMTDPRLSTSYLSACGGTSAAGSDTMSLEWDYGAVAQSYSKRPPYAPQLIADCLRATGAYGGMRACDVGAGTGNMTLPLATAGLDVVALEPNAAMRALGRSRMAASANVHWVAACAESIPQKRDLRARDVRVVVQRRGPGAYPQRDSAGI